MRAKVLSPEEQRVSDWLQALGFEVEPEPDWLGGPGIKRAEFWAHGPHDLWVEVKRVTPPMASQKGAQFWSLLQVSAEAKKKFGHGLVAIEAATTQQSVQWVVAAINAATAAEQEPSDHHFIYVGDERQECQVSVNIVPRTTIRIRGPVGDKLPASIHLPRECWQSDVTIDRPDGQVQVGKFFEFFEDSPVLCCGRAQVLDEGASFGIAGIASGDASNTAKIRADLKNAGKKFQDALRIKPAPCVVVLVPDPGALVTEQDIAIAAFGDLAVTLTPRGDKSGYETSDPFLHRNGVLRGGAHSSIGGVVLFHDEAKAIMLNHRAQRRVDERSPLLAACKRSLEWEC